MIKEMILHWASLFSGDSKLYQIDNKKTDSHYAWSGSEHESVGIS